MNRKEWKEFLINVELADLKYWQPDWKIQETKTGFYLNRPKDKLEFFIKRDILHFIFTNKYGNKQIITIKDNKVKINDIIRPIMISKFVTRIKMYGFDYDRLETILFKL